MSFFSEPICTYYEAYMPYSIYIYIYIYNFTAWTPSEISARVTLRLECRRWRDEDLEAADSGICHDKNEGTKKFACEFIILFKVT
jgi:hypothetical protein